MAKYLHPHLQGNPEHQPVTSVNPWLVAGIYYRHYGKLSGTTVGRTTVGGTTVGGVAIWIMVVDWLCDKNASYTHIYTRQRLAVTQTPFSVLNQENLFPF